MNRSFLALALSVTVVTAAAPAASALAAPLPASPTTSVSGPVPRGGDNDGCEKCVKKVINKYKKELTGPRGPKGLKGPKGDRGPAGAKGGNGPAGPAGAKGDTGPAGPAGAKGDAGTAGAKGDTGAAGPAGAKGADGPAGPAGPKGDPGPNKLFTVQQITGTPVQLPSAKDGKVTAVAKCPAGTQVVGGGFDHGDRPDVNATFNNWFWGSRANLAQNQWEVSYQQVASNGATFPITAYAYCASY